jgi:hypothetical protein
MKDEIFAEHFFLILDQNLVFENVERLKIRV